MGEERIVSRKVRFWASLSSTWFRVRVRVRMRVRARLKLRLRLRLRLTSVSAVSTNCLTP